MKRKFNHKKVIETIKDFINNNKIFLIFVLFSVLIGFFLRIKTIGFPIHYKGSLSDLLVILLIGSLSYLIKSKNRYRYYLIWLFFFSLLSFANTVYYDFYQSFISINLLSTASMV